MEHASGQLHRACTNMLQPAMAQHEVRKLLRAHRAACVHAELHIKQATAR